MPYENACCLALERRLCSNLGELGMLGEARNTAQVQPNAQRSAYSHVHDRVQASAHLFVTQSGG